MHVAERAERVGVALVRAHAQVAERERRARRGDAAALVVEQREVELRGRVPTLGRRAEARARGEARGVREEVLRSEVNIELNFPLKLREARSRLYRRRFLQVNTRWKALAEIYTMHSFAPFSNLNFFVKNRQNFFAIELMNIH